MKKNLFAGLILLLPVAELNAAETPPIVTTADATGTPMNVNVTGEVFRECTVNMPNEGHFHLGNFFVSDWVENQSWLSPGTTPEFVFTLVGCGERVQVFVSATGTPVNAENRVSWLANQNGMEPELAAAIELVRVDGSAAPLPLNGEAYLYTTTSNENSTVEVKFKGLLTRTDNSRQPIGVFRATMTVNFEFM